MNSTILSTFKIASKNCVTSFTTKTDAFFPIPMFLYSYGDQKLHFVKIKAKRKELQSVNINSQ